MTSKFEYSNVYNLKNALRGMRHAMESYDKSDSIFTSSSSVWEARSLEKQGKYLSKSCFPRMQLTSSAYAVNFVSLRE